MVRVYEQVDTAAIDGTIAACSGLGEARDVYNRQVEESGTLGNDNVFATADTDTLERSMHFESEANEPNSTSWPAGDWITRIDVTTGNANCEWDSTYVCRVNSSGVNQATIGSLLLQAQGLTAGVQTQTVSGSADTGAAATDRFYIIGGIKRKSGTHGAQGVTIKNSQAVDTPFAPVGGAEEVTDPVMGVGVVPFER